MKKATFYFLCCISVFIVCGCVSKRAAGNTANLVISEREWILVSVRADVQDDFLFPKLEHMPTLWIDKEDLYRGYDSCNNFGGNLTIVGDSIRFAPAVSTLKGCLDNEGVDNLLRMAFEQINNFSIEKNQLYLKKDSKSLIIYETR